jgi:acyl carrier protein|tara:strand:- start:1577 stop:1819 length:243 start_codon:yes stop_codon:yes gene_type:complete
MIDQNKIIGVVESALALGKGTIDINSSSDNIEKWDSLGQLSILSKMDELFNGKIAEIPDIANANSIKSIVSLLKENKLLK